MFKQHRTKFPGSISEYFDASWDKKALWELNLSSTPVQAAELMWHLDYPFWSSRPPQPLFDLKPRDVLEHPGHHPGHWDRVIAADLKYPILASRFGDRLVILDGLHRLVQAVSLGYAKINHIHVDPRYISHGST